MSEYRRGVATCEITAFNQTAGERLPYSDSLRHAPAEPHEGASLHFEDVGTMDCMIERREGEATQSPPSHSPLASSQEDRGSPELRVPALSWEARYKAVQSGDDGEPQPHDPTREYGSPGRIGSAAPLPRRRASRFQ